MVEFRWEKVSAHVFRIFGICTECMYLVQGEERAALVDTGSGYGSLKKVVDSLTDKPLVVLLTHGHTDHAMGAAEFSDVHMNAEDREIFRLHGEEGFRREGMALAEKPDMVAEEDLIPTGDCESFYPLQEGDSFDLGGYHIDIFSNKGHTKGSLAMLFREDRMLLLGDSCNTFTFLYDADCSSVTEYECSLKVLKEKTAGLYDRVLASHGNGELPITIIDEVIEVCQDIRKGITDDIPFEFRGLHGTLAWEVDENRQRKDGKNGNIIYNSSKI